MSSAEIVGYEGRARLGTEDTSGREVSVRIHDVEDPHWMAVIVAGADRVSAVGEVPVTLLDDGLYEGWQGTAVVSKRANGPMRLMGHEPFEPPVGA
jgi:hypothetical protein